MGESAIYAAAAVIAGLAVGALLGSLARRIATTHGRRRGLDGLGRPAAAIVFWVSLSIGIAAAIGLLSPGAVEPLLAAIVNYLPRVLVAVLMLIVGRAAATLAGTLLGAGLAKATGRTQRETASLLRIGITVVVVLLALGQLGVNTLVLTLAFAAVLLCLSVAMSLLIGLGGRQVAQEIAAGRYLRRIMREGDQLVAESIAGTVVALHPATTELTSDHDGTIHVPNTTLLIRPLTITRPPEHV